MEDEQTTRRTHHHAQSELLSLVISDRYDITADLPQGYQLLSFRSCSGPEQLHDAARAIYEQLEHGNWKGNQWLVVRDMSQAAIQWLSDSPRCLAGVPFRFMWVGATGLIKVVQSLAHGLTTSEVRSYITEQLLQMGMPRLDVVWGKTVTTPGGTVTTHGKQADECIYPRNRQPVGGQFRGWPTLVIETGVSESLAKLRRDATWWFQNSSADTRIVLLVAIKRATKEVRIEKWQLAPPNLPQGTRQAIAQLRQQPDQMPPLVQQQAGSQVAFSIQEIVITPAAITGGPLVIPFQALADRQPTGAEGDIVINNQGWREITRCV